MAGFHLESQDDGTVVFRNEYFETIRTYPNLQEAQDHLAGSATIGPAYHDIGGFEMREVTPA